MAQNFVTFLLIIFTAFIVGTGVFLWQESEKETLQDKYAKEKAGLEADLGARTTELNRAVKEKEDLQKKYCKGTWKDGICIMASCVDSDVNEKPDDIYIKGSVTYTDQNGVATTVYDECSGTNIQVNELWCYESPKGSGNYVQGRMVYDCPKGCLDGACLK